MDPGPGLEGNIVTTQVALHNDMHLFANFASRDIIFSTIAMASTKLPEVAFAPASPLDCHEGWVYLHVVLQLFVGLLHH
jgi:hypothetical protein